MSDGIREVDMTLTRNFLLVSFVPALRKAANLKRLNPGYRYRQKDQLAQPTNLNRMHRYRFNGEHGDLFGSVIGGEIGYQ